LTFAATRSARSAGSSAREPSDSYSAFMGGRYELVRGAPVFREIGAAPTLDQGEGRLVETDQRGRRRERGRVRADASGVSAAGAGGVLDEAGGGSAGGGAGRSAGRGGRERCRATGRHTVRYREARSGGSRWAYESLAPRQSVAAHVAGGRLEGQSISRSSSRKERPCLPPDRRQRPRLYSRSLRRATH
jgi:hypothetical protein